MRKAAATLDRLQDDPHARELAKAHEFARQWRQVEQVAQRAEGRAEGVEVGRAEGVEVGRAEGVEVGRAEGVEVGRAEGVEVGRAEGVEVGRAEGVEVGLRRAVLEICEVLGVVVPTEGTRALSTMNAASLERLLVAIKTARAWPR
jgi:flagellar biosynthesis/type III secretory pathway protein FliH